VAADHLLGCLNRSYRAATIGSSFRAPGQMLFSLLPHLQRRILMMFQDERIRLISRESAQYTTPGLSEEDLLKVRTRCCLLRCLCLLQLTESYLYGHLWHTRFYMQSCTTSKDRMKGRDRDCQGNSRLPFCAGSSCHLVL
jgi:hypothetical protein